MSDQNANEDELLQVALKPNGYPPVETIRAPFVYPVDENRLPGNFSVRCLRHVFHAVLCNI